MLVLPPGGTKPPAGFYNFDQAKGEAIVQQLGGLSFTLLVSNTVTTATLLLYAVQAQWQACGMKVTLNPVSTAASNQLREPRDSSRCSRLANGGTFDPYPVVAPYSVPSSSTDIDDVNSLTITNLIDATGYTTNTLALRKIWTRVYDTEDALAVNIPLLYTHLWYFNAAVGAWPRVQRRIHDLQQCLGQRGCGRRRDAEEGRKGASGGH